MTSALASNHEVRFHLRTAVPHQKVFVASELTEWEPGVMAMEESTPGDYSLVIPEPWLKRLEYRFVVDGKWMNDPANPDQIPDGMGGSNSYLNLSFKEDPLLQPTPQLAQWKKSVIEVRDFEGSKRKITLASPPKNKTGRKRAVVIYFQDGQDYLTQTSVLNLFANLSDKADMPLFYGVFVPPKDREREYGLTATSKQYVDFLSRTVVEAAEQKLELHLAAKDRLLIGPSLGGVITLYTAFQHPEVFPFAASQSAAQEITDPQLFDLIARAPNGKPSRLFVETGVFEPKDWVAYTRKVRDTATDAAIPMRYEEYPSTHDWPAWQNRLSVIFDYFFKN